MKKSIKKDQVATTIAILFHVIGLIGMLFGDQQFFIRISFINLLLSFLLLLYTQKQLNKFFILFLVICYIIGIAVELAGTKTGLLFGNYTYGNVLGPEIFHVPLIIGINWFIIIYCCGITIQTMLNRLTGQVALHNQEPTYKIKMLSIIVDGALLAVFFDWLMEPVAVKLGYWQWKNGEVPFFNYVSWFLISALLLIAFHYSGFNKENKFAVNLLLIQAMFFLLLRTFL